MRAGVDPEMLSPGGLSISITNFRIASNQVFSSPISHHRGVAVLHHRVRLRRALAGGRPLLRLPLELSRASPPYERAGLCFFGVFNLTAARMSAISAASSTVSSS